jgi:hypothetical protein
MQTPENLNDDLPWSVAAIEDLLAGVAHGESLAEIADFLCRSEDQVREEAIALGLIDEFATG